MTASLMKFKNMIKSKCQNKEGISVREERLEEISLFKSLTNDYKQYKEETE